MSRKTTMQDIADEIGVSRTTVSLVLKGEGSRYRIAEMTQRRILEQVRKSGFKANYFASALNRKRTGVIGVVVPDLMEEFMSQILRGIEDVILNTEFMPMICSTRFMVERERRQIEQLRHRGVDGLIVAPTAVFQGQPRPIDFLQTLVDENYPLVFLDRYLPELSVPHVVQDDAAGGRLAAETLRDLGVGRFGYLGFDLDITSLSLRRSGFEFGLNECGYGLDEASCILLTEINPDALDLEIALRDLHAKGNLPDGFLVSTAGLALRCRDVLTELNLRVGKDIHLIRFGRADLSPDGPIHGIHQPHSTMGRTAAETLLHLIENKPGETQSTVLPIQLDPIPTGELNETK